MLHFRVLCAFVIALVFISNEARAVDFYSKATGDPNNTATWGLNTDGTGAAPADFTTAGQVFILTNANAGTLTANWTVSGAGSKVIVGEGLVSQTLNTSTFLIVGTFDVANLGTLNVQSNSSFTVGNCATGSTVNYSLNNTQSIQAGVYHHLLITNASAARTKTATGDITVNGNLDITSNNTLAMGTNLLSGVFGTITGSGSITTQNTTGAPIPAGKIWTQNITYSSASSQTVVKGIYTLALSVNGGSRVFPTGGDTVEVRGAFTASTASVTYTTTGTRFVFSGGTQTLTFVSTSAFNFGFVSFTVSSAATKTIAGAGISVDTLNVGSSCTLAMTTFQLSGTLSSIGGNGIITTTNTGATPIPSGKVWTQTVNYSGATQTIVAGTYASLTYAAGTKTASGDLIVNTLLTSTGTLELGLNTITGNFTNSGTGTINTQNTTATPIPAGKIWTQTIVYNATTTQTVVKGGYAGLNVTGTGATAHRIFPGGMDTIEVRGTAGLTAANTSGATYTTAGTRFVFTTASKTLTFNSGSTFNMEFASFSGSFTNTIAGHNLRADTIVVGSGAVLNLATFLLSGSLNSITGIGTIQTQNTSATPLPSRRTWTQNITYNSTGAQTVVKGLYSLALNVNGGSRSFPTGGDSVEVRGAFTASTASVTYTTTGTRFVFSGAAQTLTFVASSPFNFSFVSFTATSAQTKTIAGSGFTADTLDVGNLCTLGMVTFALGGNLNSITGPGTITTQNTSATPLVPGKIWTQNVTYNSTASQTVVKGIYTLALTVTGTGASAARVFPGGGDTIEVRGGFAAANTAGATYTTTGTRFIFSGSAQTLTFNTGSSFNFGYVSFAGTAASTKTIAGAGFTVDTIDIASTITVNMVTFALGGTVNVNTGSGTLNTQALLTAIPSGKSWSFAVNYSSTAVDQNVIGGTYQKLTLSLSGNTARTKIVTGNITVNDTLLVTASGNSSGDLLINMQTNRLIAGGGFVLTNGGASANKDFSTQCTDPSPLPADITWPALGIVTYNAAGNQTVVSGTYSALTFSVSGNRTLSSTGDIDITGNFIASDAAVTIVGGVSSNMRFTGVAQNITLGAGGSFNNFRVQGTGNKTVIASTGTLTVNGELEVLSGRTLVMNNNAIAGSLASTLGTGTITTLNTTSTPFPAGETWTQSISYLATTTQTVVHGIIEGNLSVNASTGNRTFSDLGTIEVKGNFTASQATVTYTTTNTTFNFSGANQTLTFVATSLIAFNNVSFSGSGTKTIAGAGFNVNGNLGVTNGVTLNMVTFAMGGNPAAISGTGTIATQVVSAAIPANEVWTQTVNYNYVSNTQNLVSGRYANLLLTLTGTTSRSKTASGNITVDSALTFSTSSTGIITLTMGSNRLIDGGACTVVNTGTLRANAVTTTFSDADTSIIPLPRNQTWPGPVTYSSASLQTVVSGVYTGNLVVTGGPRVFSGNGTIEVMGSFAPNTASTTYTNNGSSFLFSGGNQTLTFVATSTFTFNNLSFTGTGTKTIATTGFNVNGDLHVASGVTLNMVTFAMGGNPAVISGTGIIRTQNTATALPVGEVWTQTVQYDGVSQNISGGVYEKLGLIKSGGTARTKTAIGADITVNDTLTLIANGTAALNVVMSTFNLVAGSPSFVFYNADTTIKNFTTQSTAALPLPSNITWPGTVTYSAVSDSQVISKGVYRNLTLSGASYKVAEGSIRVRGTLNLGGSNPDLYRGYLNMGVDTLLMDTDAAIFSGTGDVSGIVRRVGPLTAGFVYMFGSQFTRITMPTSGMLPSEISVRITLGDTLPWKTNAVLRQYEIIQTGGTDTAATIQLRYLSGELNNNIESRLVIWEDSIGGAVEKGRSFINTTSKFVELTDVDIANYPSSFGTSYSTVAVTLQPQVIWVGVTDNSWATASNWDPTFIPDSTDDVIIPDSASTPFSPLLSATSRVKTISIEAGGVLTSPSGGQLFVYGGSTSGLSSWDCSGTFYPSTGTVTFLGTDATYVGTTNFNNVVIADTAILTNRESSVMRIGNSITNLGIWRVAALTESTVEYNGNSAQTVINPNGIVTSGYYNLVLSGTGAKTLPSDFNMKGNFINNGTLSNTARIVFNGNTDQSIGGSSSTVFDKLIAQNGNTLLLEAAISVNDSLRLTNGVLYLNEQNLTLGGTISGAGTITGNALSSITINGSGDFGKLVFTAGMDTLDNLTINRAAGAVTMGNNMRVEGTLTITNGQLAIDTNTLTLDGNFVGNVSGTLSGNGVNSKLHIEGSGTMGSLFFDQTRPDTTNRFEEISINRASQTITLGNPLQISHTVIPVAGTLQSAGNLILVSDSTRTARIADGNCTTCSYIAGNVVVQRYVQSVARRWRFVGSPVQLTTLADWQGETFITGPGGSSNGFDQSNSNAPSSYWYNETITTGDLNAGWTSPARTSDTMPVGRGYRLFIRGDRSDTNRLINSNATQNAVTLNIVGVPNQGDITMPVTCTFSGVGNTYDDANDGWVLLSNPYASPYDWDAHFSNGSFQNNIGPNIWMLDAPTGGYASYNAISHDGDLDGGIIPSGASFWVKATDASPSLTFKEQFKVGTTPKAVFKTSIHGTSFTIKLTYDSITSDKVVVKYLDNVSTELDESDIRKLPGTVTISAYGNDGIQLALTSRPTTFDVDTIKLRVNGAPGAYKLQFTNSDKLPLTDYLLLFDTYTETVTDLKITGQYNFSIVSGNPLSQGLNRFYIVAGNSNAVPVHLLHFTARKAALGKVKLSWATAQETNSDVFEIERSADGKTYSKIAEVNAGGNTQRVLNYAIVDELPLQVNYYRLKQVDIDGSAHYSSVVRVVVEEAGSAVLNMYPIPAIDYINIEHPGTVTQLNIWDAEGKRVWSQLGVPGVNTINVTNLKSGVYIVECIDDTGSVLNGKFTKE